MKPAWLFESDVFEEAVPRLVAEARRQGLEAKVAARVRYREGELYTDLYPPHACVVYHGSLASADTVRRRTSWVPGVFGTPRLYDCTAYYPYVGDRLLAEDYTMLPWGEVPRKQGFLFETFGIDGTVFIRPNSGGKVFTGRTICRDTLDRDLADIGYAGLDPSTLVVVSPPRNIESEWRFVVADRKVIAGSLYRRAGRLLPRAEASRAAVETAEAAAARYEPDRVWTCDVCRTVAGNYYVIEINSFSCAGLYACAAEPIVREVSRIALEEWEAVN